MNAINMKKINPKKLILDVLITLVGCILYAVAIVLFTSPNHIAPGGVIGVSTLLNYLFDFLPIGTLTIVVNIPIFILGAVAIGWKYLSSSIVCSVVSAVIMDGLDILVNEGIVKPYVGEGILAAAFGGLICGVGIALIFSRGGSTGGTDIVARVLHDKLPHVSQGTFMLLVDAVVVLTSAFVYGDVEYALYAIICIFMFSRAIDTVLYGVSRNNGKLLFIVTDKYDDITEAILDKIDRGVTLLKAEGGYRRDNKRVLLVAVRPNQVHSTTTLVHEIDSDAFVITTTANSIKGKGFHAYDEAEDDSHSVKLPRNSDED